MARYQVSRDNERRGLRFGGRSGEIQRRGSSGGVQGYGQGTGYGGGRGRRGGSVGQGRRHGRGSGSFDQGRGHGRGRGSFDQGRGHGRGSGSFGRGRGGSSFGEGRGYGVGRGRGGGSVGQGRGSRRRSFKDSRIPKTAVEAFRILYGDTAIKTENIDVNAEVLIRLEFKGLTATFKDIVKSVAVERAHVDLMKQLMLDAKRRNEDVRRFQGFALMMAFNNLEEEDEKNRPTEDAVHFPTIREMFTLYYPNLKVEQIYHPSIPASSHSTNVNMVATCNLSGKVIRFEGLKEKAEEEVMKAALSLIPGFEEDPKFTSIASVTDAMEEDESGFMVPGYEVGGDSNAGRLAGERDSFYVKSGLQMVDLNRLLATKDPESGTKGFIICIGTVDHIKIHNASKSKRDRLKSSLIKDVQHFTTWLSEKGIGHLIFVDSPRCSKLPDASEFFLEIRGRLEVWATDNNKALDVVNEKVMKEIADGKCLITTSDAKHFHAEFIPRLRTYISGLCKCKLKWTD